MKAPGRVTSPTVLVWSIPGTSASRADGSTKPSDQTTDCSTERDHGGHRRQLHDRPERGDRLLTPHAEAAHARDRDRGRGEHHEHGGEAPVRVGSGGHRRHGPPPAPRIADTLHVGEVDPQ